MSAAPTWGPLLAPCLRVLQDGQVHRTRPIVDHAADFLGVTDEQRKIVTPSGQEQWGNRGNRALSYLARSCSAERPSRRRYRIAEVDRTTLADHPEGIAETHSRALSGSENDPHTFERFPSPRQASAPIVAEEASQLDPQEQIASGVVRTIADDAGQLLTRILAQEPVFFEQAVLDLLIAMGYGGAEGSATRPQVSSDGGIDGVVDQDALGLSRIYVQAKRYAEDNAIGRPAVQAFVGALAGNQANQGVFITTSRFSSEAQTYAEQVPTHIELIDGEKLTRLMIRYGVGVQVKRTVQIVEMDEDFFE